MREALENGPPDTAFSRSHEDTSIRNALDLEGGSHPITDLQAAPSSEQPSNPADNGQPFIPQFARRPLLILLACLLVYVLPLIIYYSIPENIHPWICDRTLQYLALITEAVATFTMWNLGGFGGQRGQNVQDSLPNERGARPLGLHFPGPKWCQYLCIVLMFVLSVFISVAGVHGCSVLDPKILCSDLGSLVNSLGEMLKMWAKGSALLMDEE